MRALKGIGFAIGVLLVVLALFGFGYYRGYHDRSRILSTVHLAIDEGIYEHLQKGDLDRASYNARSTIYLTAASLRMLQRTPFRHFLHELASSRANPEKILKRASDLTKGMDVSELTGPHETPPPHQ